METYERCVTTIFPIFVPWLTDHDNLPQYPDGEAWGYATNRAVAIQQLKLRQRYVEAVIQRGCPLPELKKCHPYITTGWNKTKIGIDGPCKFLSDAAPVHKKCSAPKMFFLRDIRYRAYNAMAMWRLLMNYCDIDDIKSYKHFKTNMGQKISFDEALAYLVSEGNGQCLLIYFVLL